MPGRTGLEYLGLLRIEGPLVFVKGIEDVGFGEIAEVVTPENEVRLGRVLSVSDDVAVVEVFQGTVWPFFIQFKSSLSGTPLFNIVFRLRRSWAVSLMVWEDRLMAVHRQLPEKRATSCAFR